LTLQNAETGKAVMAWRRLSWRRRLGWQAGGWKLGQQAVEELGVNLVLMGGRSQLRLGVRGDALDGE